MLMDLTKYPLGTKKSGQFCTSIKLRWLRVSATVVIFCFVNMSNVTSPIIKDPENANPLLYAPVADQILLPSVGEVQFCYDEWNGTLKPRQTTTTIYLNDTEPEHPFDGCFVMAIFGLSPDGIDRVMHVWEARKKYPNYDFILFTNLVDFDAESIGWRKVLHFDSVMKRMITQSRYPKFLGWKEDFIQKHCPVVFYLDGIASPQGSLEEFNQLKKEILQSKGGLAQRRRATLDKELYDIGVVGKDTQEHINMTRAWLHSQPDFKSWDTRLYGNNFFGYNPKSNLFQNASQYFWDIYSKEQMSWRDQPLWTYSLHHVGLEPILFSASLFSSNGKREGGRRGGHTYDNDSEKEVDSFLTKLCLKSGEIVKSKEELFHLKVCSKYCSYAPRES